MYVAGETVTFTIGGITIGSATAASTLTPVSLISGATNETNSTVTNITSFLMSLDDDGDASNGIKITSATVTAAASQTVDFTVSTVAFQADSAIVALVTTLTGSNTTPQTSLTSVANAQSHLNTTLSGITTDTGGGSTYQIEGSTWSVQTDTSIDVSSAGWTLQFAQDGTYTNYRRDVVAAVDSAMAADCTMSGTYSAVTSTTLTMALTADSCWTPTNAGNTYTSMSWSIDDTVTPNVLTFSDFIANKL